MSCYRVQDVQRRAVPRYSIGTEDAMTLASSVPMEWGQGGTPWQGSVSDRRSPRRGSKQTVPHGTVCALSTLRTMPYRAQTETAWSAMVFERGIDMSKTVSMSKGREIAPSHDVRIDFKDNVDKELIERDEVFVDKLK